MIQISQIEYEAIKKIVEYMYDDEKKHYLESGKEDREDHIYTYVKQLKHLATYQRKGRD